jgi:hypothetical protein
MKIHLPIALCLGRLLMPLLRAMQRKMTNVRASKNTAAKNMSSYETSFINGCLGFPAMQTSRITLRRPERR